MTAAAPTYTGFATLEELRAANLAMMRAWRAQGTDGNTDTREIDGFIRRAIATGKRLSSSPDRELAQSALDFWSTELVRLGRAAPGETAGPQLARFDPAALPVLGEVSPFKGLKSYDEIDAAIFHGREEVVRKLAGQVEARAVTLVVGPGGSGKASLIGAGLLPALRERGVIGDAGRLQLLRIASPGTDPLQKLAELLLGDNADIAALRSLRDRLEARPETFGAELSATQPRPVLLIVTQFEEILTLGASPAARDAFARAIASLGRDSRLIVSLRDDFLDDVRRLPALGEIAADPGNRFLPPPIAPADLKRAVIAIADRAGLRFAEGVLDRLVRAIAGEPAGLPLLQFTLDELWREARRSRTNWISEEVEQRVGQPRQALQRAAERVYQALPLPDKEDIVRDLFLLMVTPGLDHDFVRKPRRRGELRAGRNADSVDRVLAAFTDAGLLRLEQGAVTSDDWYDVTHEALMRNWPRLRTWLDRQRQTHRKLLQLREVAKLWANEGKAAGYLLSGDALVEARAFEGQSEVLDTLISESAKVERQTRSTVLFLKLTGLAIAAGLLAVGFIYWQARHATQLMASENARIAADNQKAAAENARAAAEYARAAAENAKTAARARLMQIEAELRQSLDSLNVSDIGPLRKFLRNYGDAQESELDRLRLQPNAAPSGSDLRSQVVATRQRSINTPTQNSSCRGYLWLGYAGEEKVAPFPSGGEMSTGTRLTLNTSVRLRADRPDADYTMAPQIGIVPRDAVVKVVGDVFAVPRSRGQQYWAEVETARQYCTSVFIQYAGSRQEQIGAMRSRLDEAGFQVPAPQQENVPRGRAEVRYFFAADAPMAAEVARLLAAYNKGQPLTQTSLLNFPTPPRAGTLEVWIDLDP